MVQQQVQTLLLQVLLIVILLVIPLITQRPPFQLYLRQALIKQMILLVSRLVKQHIRLEVVVHQIIVLNY